ncbi:hypothetical protein BN59_00553 [Legionella massiliensis]|uniref:Uncharacterized protein n=1 Tax=Legionella massiliensis TaxID=1034943 RepID=A0A078KT92_9GAMM|nr:hypothetical protein [Legionella massiliensis]CDZ76286.1 hypothetical protein BN59_00553 [Legionella massiliensis]CEE12024.1 hypothetical protein BN1094_00553 [Legionella massiliensis]
MKKLYILLFASLCLVSLGYASKLSKYMHKADAQDQARQQQEWRRDMDFNDLAFRLVRRYTDDHGQRCRDYEFRARSNPYRHGYYTVCDER